MTRPEITGKRDLEFSGWIRRKLPDSSTGFCVSDIDFMLWNFKTKRMMILEVKTHGKMIRDWQARQWDKVDHWLAYGIKFDPEWTYLGFHVLRFEKTWFDDGAVEFDDRIITEEQLIKVLSL